MTSRGLQTRRPYQFHFTLNQHTVGERDELEQQVEVAAVVHPDRHPGDRGRAGGDDQVGHAVAVQVGQIDARRR